MHINYLAVVVAAVAAFLLGWSWYTVFGKVWMSALGKSKEECDKTQHSSTPLIIAAVSCFVMAWMLAGLMGHFSDVTTKGGGVSAIFVWIGFVLTTGVLAGAEADLFALAARVEQDRDRWPGLLGEFGDRFVVGARQRLLVAGRQGACSNQHQQT